jgi:hypothetical protein
MDALACSIPVRPGTASTIPTSAAKIRRHDQRTRWLLQRVAAILGVSPPAAAAEELQWTSVAFSETSAMTLYLAGCKLADAGRLEDALDVIDDACRAQRSHRPLPAPLVLPRSREPSVPTGPTYVPA